MGSSNAPWGISRLPLEQHDDIKIIFLVRKRCFGEGDLASLFRSSAFKEGSLGYSTDAWAPILFPLSAKYNDYGTIKSIKKDLANDLLISYFQKANLYNISSLKKIEFSNLNDLFKLIEREEICISYEEEEGFSFGIKGNFYKLHYFFIHNNIYKSLINKKKTILPESYIEEILKEIEKDFEGPDNYFKYQLLYYELFRLIDFQQDMLLVMKVLEDCNFTFETFKKSTFLKEHLKLKRLFHFMENTRIPFAPQSGKGSQAYCNDDYDCLIKSMQKLISIKKAKLL
jgi:hypothetical protein